MKQLCLTLLSLCLTVPLLFVQAQGIRAVSDNKPAVHKTATVGTPATYTGRQIVVGSGGGFTGFSSQYYLLDNGKLFARRSRDTTFTYIGQQPTTKIKRLFSTIERTCRIRTTKFDHPGNIYKFVQWRRGKRSHKVTWGESGKTVPVAYPKFYNSFMTLIPTSSRLN